MAADNVLIIETDPSFASLLHQLLTDTGKYTAQIATSGTEALTHIMRDSFSLIMIASTLPDLPATALVQEVLQNDRDLSVIVIAPEGEPLPAAWEGLRIEGTLSKPFHIPEFVRLLNAVGDLDIKEPTVEITPDMYGRLLAEHPTGNTRLLGDTPAPDASAPDTPPQPATPPADNGDADKPNAEGSWLSDVNKAAQYLTGVTLESQAEAAILTRGSIVHAYAGQFPRAEVEELAETINANWDGDSSQGAQVRFVRMKNGADYLLYSTTTTDDIVLSLAFAADTPLRSIRKQARKLVNSLLDETSLAAAMPAPKTAATTADAKTGETPGDTALGNIVNPGPAEETKWDERLKPLVDTSFDMPDLPDAPQVTAADTAPADWQLSPSQNRAPSQPETTRQRDDTAPADWGAHPAPDDTAEGGPVIYGAAQKITGVPGVYRTPHGLYRLTYAFLWLPKLPDISLQGDIVDRLAQWLRQLAIAYDWRLEDVAVETDCVMVIVACSPADSPENVVRTLMDNSSERVMQEFPRMRELHPSGQFWAPGYQVVTPGRTLSKDEIARYIAYQRKQQGLG